MIMKEKKSSFVIYSWYHINGRGIIRKNECKSKFFVTRQNMLQTFKKLLKKILDDEDCDNLN